MQGDGAEVLPTVPPELAAVIAAGARAAREVPGAVALGGTVCAMYARHRMSVDIDFVVRDLRDRFDEVREHMLEVPGWAEARAQPPVLILGSLDKVDIGFRQLRRDKPLETCVVVTPEGPLVVPAADELLRIKAVLAYQRNKTRDYADLAELSLVVGTESAVRALAVIDEFFATAKRPSLVLEVAKNLIVSAPDDSPEQEFTDLVWLRPRLSSWEAVARRCRELGERTAAAVLEAA